MRPGQVAITAEGAVSRAYARLWARVPFMARGVPGCGLFALNAAGRARWGDWPAIISTIPLPACISLRPSGTWRRRAMIGHRPKALRPWCACAAGKTGVCRRSPRGFPRFCRMMTNSRWVRPARCAGLTDRWDLQCMPAWRWPCGCGREGRNGRAVDDTLAGPPRAAILGHHGDGFGATQVIRLASNLILTRLLFPEAFGMMAIVSVFIMGLAMFSDIGPWPGDHGQPKGDDRDFLNTAWTIQIARGLILYLRRWPAPGPSRQWYAEAQLLQLLPVAALTLVISAFNPRGCIRPSPSSGGRVTMIDVAVQLVGILVAVALAWWWHSVWALVISNIAAAFAHLFLLNLILPGEEPAALGQRAGARTDPLRQMGVPVHALWFSDRTGR